MQGQHTFEGLRAVVARRADASPPFRSMPLADLRVSDDGCLVLPGGARFAIGEAAGRQLASLLDLRWERWFRDAPPAERAAEANAWLARSHLDAMFLLRNGPPDGGDGAVRAILAPGPAPVDDRRALDALAAFGGLAGEFSWSADFADDASYFAASRARGYDLGDGLLLLPGFVLRCSEAGAHALTLDDAWFDEAREGRVLVRAGGRRSLKLPADRPVPARELAAALAGALARLPFRQDETFPRVRGARSLAVPHPADTVAAILGRDASLAGIAEAAARSLEPGVRYSRFGAAWAVAGAARLGAPGERFAAERLAGDYLVALKAPAWRWPPASPLRMPPGP